MLLIGKNLSQQTKSILILQTLSYLFCSSSQYCLVICKDLMIFGLGFVLTSIGLTFQEDICSEYSLNPKAKNFYLLLFFFNFVFNFLLFPLRMGS